MDLRSKKDSKSSLTEIERTKSSKVEDSLPKRNNFDLFERNRVLWREIGQPIFLVAEAQPQIGTYFIIGQLITNIGIVICALIAVYVLVLCFPDNSLLKSGNDLNINDDSPDELISTLQKKFKQETLKQETSKPETSEQIYHIPETSVPYLKSKEIFTKECLESESNSCLILYIPRKVEYVRDFIFDKLEEKEITEFTNTLDQLKILEKAEEKESTKLTNTLDKLKIYRSDDDDSKHKAKGLHFGTFIVHYGISQ